MRKQIKHEDRKTRSTEDNRPKLDAVAAPVDESIIELGGDLVTPLPEPWPEKVSGPSLIGEMVATIRSFVSTTEDHAVAIALWIIHAHAIDAFRISPILALPSPTKRCGKTTMLSIISYMVPRPMTTARTTPAAVYRATEEATPTLIVDEADTFIHTGGALRGILNSGHTRDAAYVAVVEKGRTRRFRTWCPKVIAAIGSLPDTIEDRSVVVPMRRKSTSERLESLRVDTAKHFEPICRKAVRWAKDNFAKLTASSPSLPRELHDRAADNWFALLAVADVIGGKYPALARKAAVRMAGIDATQHMAIGEMLLRDIRDILDASAIDMIESAHLADALATLEHRPWPEFVNGRPITKSKLAGTWRPFGISPTLIRRGKRVFRGYRLSDFKDAFQRYAA